MSLAQSLAGGPIWKVLPETRVAVAAEVRGKGIGSALMHAAHRWMQHRGAREAQVVTQLVNLPACRLYERSGYRLSRVQHYFHFWL